MSHDRVLDLEGVHNFRDHGGYAVAGGGRLKRGILWRSGQHHGASDADLARIAALDLAHVFDLRSGGERQSHPCRRPGGFAASLHIAADPEVVHVPHTDTARGSRGRDGAQVREGMVRNYRKMPFRPQLVEAMRDYLGVLASDGRPSLINCMAGKDRTGVAVAVLHLAVGVHPDDAVADYVLTNSAGNPEERIAAGADTIRAMTGDLPDDVLRALMGVEPEYLLSAFEGMREEHGSTDSYLRDVVGADESLRARLRERLVES